MIKKFIEKLLLSKYELIKKIKKKKKRRRLVVYCFLIFFSEDVCVCFFIKHHSMNAFCLSIILDS